MPDAHGEKSESSHRLGLVEIASLLASLLLCFLAPVWGILWLDQNQGRLWALVIALVYGIVLWQSLRRASARISSTQGNIPAELNAIIQQLRQPPRDDRDMPRRVELCQHALAMLSSEQNPPLWAELQRELANSLAQNPLDSRVANLEQAIHHCKQALTVYTRDAFPQQWAMTQHNLGTAYSERIAGERAANLEQAIGHYEQALAVYTRDTFPQQWATTQNNLAGTYSKRIAGERAANLEEAIHHLEQMVAVYTRDTFPQQWAMAQHNLATTYSERIAGGRAANLEQAIHYYKEALAVRTRDAFPADWAMTQNNLGIAYSKRIAGGRAANLEQAIHHYEQALTVYTRDAFPTDWAMTQNNLAVAYSERVAGERAVNVEQAIHHYEQALAVYTRDAFLVIHRMTQRNLGHLHFEQGAWQAALAAYLTAIETGDDLLVAASSESSRQAEIAETSAQFVRAAYCLLQLGDPGAALVQLEAGKTRLLSEALALADADFASLPHDQQQVLADARDTIRALDAKFRLPPDAPARRSNVELMALLREARASLRALVDSIRAEQSHFMPQGLDLPGILALVPPDGALVAPMFTSHGNAVFVVPSGLDTVTEEHVVRLNDFIYADLGAIVVGKKDDPGWLFAYFNRSADLSAWLARMELITGQLWEQVLAPVHTRLQTLGAQRVILMPPGLLGLLPLHAAWREENGTRRYFLDDYIVRYAPSAYALDAAQRRPAAREGVRSAMVAGVSEYSHLNNLPNVSAEVDAIAALFGTSALHDSQVTEQAVLDGARGAAYVHLACHGGFDWGDALRSGLILADDEPLTLADILGQMDLDLARLVALSACETGITDIQQSPDEYVGLPAGFMQAGALGVVSSLWMVDDRSTTLLMERFYIHHLEDGLPPAEALREAQLWLRTATAEELDLSAYYAEKFEQTGDKDMYRRMRYFRANPDQRPFANIYFWGCFYFTGI